MNTQIIFIRDIVGAVPYWSKGENLKIAKKNYKKFSKRFPSKNAVITGYWGLSEKIYKITVNDLGDIISPAGLVRIDIQ